MVSEVQGISGQRGLRFVKTVLRAKGVLQI